ncbi:transcription factor Clamp [Hoplias malabaricus]|uniref:transcription factor Clamp n=1 Tax=Hoplias malabaricus TaxID=27720 RepID=UPI003461DC88
MTQMDLLVTNVAELLATAVQEVLRLMGQAVTEYREESDKIRQENQKLQQQLEQLQKRLETADAVQQVSSSETPEVPSFQLPCEEKEALVSEQESKGPEPLSFKEENPSEIQLEFPEESLNKTWQTKPRSPAGNSSPKSGRCSASLRMTTTMSPDPPKAPEHVNVGYVMVNKIKSESNSEPLECSLAGHSEELMDSDSVFNTLPLEDGQNHLPCSPESAFLLQEQYSSPHAHILSSRLDNMLDIPGIPHTEMKRKSSHSCHICGKTFATSSSLGAHFVCHSNERPFVCNCCNFRFSRSADLKKHERIHTGEKPYNCSLCGRRFNRTENLRRHLRKVHHGAML